MTPGFSPTTDRHDGALLYRPFHRDRLSAASRRIKVLAAYAPFAMLLCSISAFSGGQSVLLALTLCSAFMSINPVPDHLLAGYQKIWRNN